MAQKVKPKDSDLLVQANKVNLAKHELSAVQKKIVALVYSKVRMSDEDFQEYEFQRMDIAKAMNRTKDKDYSWLKEESVKLVKQVIRIPNPESKDGWIISGFFSAITYNAEKGTVKFTLAPKLKPYFLKLKSEYTIVPLLSVMKLSGKYALRLLDIILQWWSLVIKLGHYTFTIDLDDLRTAWGLETKYPKGKAFRQFVINPAIMEINAADLGFRVEVDSDMAGRRTRGFIFHVTAFEGDTKPAEIITAEDEVDDEFILTHQIQYEALLNEIKNQDDLFPNAGYSTPFMRERAQRADALKRLRAELEAKPLKRQKKGRPSQPTL